jgi:aspartate/methionine/tyrosine aminotransferase
MNKKDKIEARKAIFDMHKVFIICTFLYSNMVINYDKFNFFTSKYRNKKKIVIYGLSKVT